MRAVIYARYSSDLQRDASIEDQIEVCRRYAEAQGWTIVGTYKDAAISGASRFRPGFQKLIADAAQRRFESVCEAIDRLGRRLADTADLQDQLAFQRIRLYTPALGEITPIHVAVMGMMAQMALKDLGEKTKRGQLGRVLKGRVPAGIAYGYKTADGGGDGRGARLIDPDEAGVVRRIFKEFASGKSPEAIARDLNRESVPGPAGRLWSNTTIRGQLDRGTGILNNALYRGVIEWNRCAYTKNPKTGKRVARPNAPEQWERVEVPELRIVDVDLWFSAKTRQHSMRQAMGKALSRNNDSANHNPLNEAHRPRFLLSGLLRCGCCNGPYAIVGRDRYACSTRKQKGTCDNRLTITRQEIEARVLEGLKERLLAPDLVAVFVSAFRDESKRQRDALQAEWAGRERKAAELDRKIASIFRAIEDGLYEPAMKARLVELKEKRDRLKTESRAFDPAALDVLMHPQLAEGYRRRIERLERLLEGSEQDEAREIVRSMIERVALTPRADGSGLDATLFGALAALLSVSAEVSGKKRPSAARPSEGQLSVVAGARYQRYLPVLKSRLRIARPFSRVLFDKAFES